jgi:hypothetical protein
MLTKQDIINDMLSVVGEGGVSNIDTLHPSVQVAERIFNAQNLEFQMRGWWFNTEQRLKLVRDSAGRVEMPAGTLKFSVYNIANKTASEKTRYTKRGKYIYDTILHTNVINVDLCADITLLLDVTDLPATASNFIRHRCRELMYVDDDGDQFKTEKLERYRMEAWQALKAEEMSILAASALDNPTARSLRSGYMNGGAMVSIDGGGQR